jgi:hypothetical protein
MDSTSSPAYVAWLTSQQRPKKTKESGNENLADSIWTPQSISPVDFLDMLDGEGQVRSERYHELIENKLAEREGFEPSVGLTLRRFSKPVPSATRPPLRERVLLRKLLVIRENGLLSQEEVKFKSDSFFVLNCRL